MRPGDRVPLDGIIREGKSSLDQSRHHRRVHPGGQEARATGVLRHHQLRGRAGVEVTRLSSESVLARVVDMVAQAEAQKGPNQRFAQRVETHLRRRW